MAAINLDSLSTLWQSIKAYFADVFLYRTDETVLYEDSTGAGATSVQLSGALAANKSYRITFRTNDNVGYTQTFRWYGNATARFILVACNNNVGSTARSYVKMARVDISSDLKTLTISNTTQSHINASSVTSGPGGNIFYITKVVETVI